MNLGQWNIFSKCPLSIIKMFEEFKKYNFCAMKKLPFWDLENFLMLWLQILLQARKLWSTWDCKKILRSQYQKFSKSRQKSVRKTLLRLMFHLLSRTGLDIPVDNAVRHNYCCCIFAFSHLPTVVPGQWQGGGRHLKLAHTWGLSAP